jgi:hypothetical protein
MSMLKRFIYFVTVAAILSSCGNASKKEASSTTEGSEGTAKVEFASLASTPDTYVGKTITVQGKVVHVCTESGKKLFIVGENPDVRLYIQAGENMPKFPMDLLGSTVVVEGLVTKIGATAMAGEEKPAGEGMHAGGGMHSGEGAMKAGSDSCATETALAAQTTLANIVMEYKSHTVL